MVWATAISLVSCDTGVYPTLAERRDFANGAIRHVEQTLEQIAIRGAALPSVVISFSFVNEDLRMAFRYTLLH